MSASILFTNETEFQKCQAFSFLFLIHYVCNICKFYFRPTVGVDPVLKNKIWKFLQSLTTTSDTTVIISTQYMQEAMNSTIVGYIRNGTLIVENEPQIILQNLKVDNIEEAFLNLSLQQGVRENVDRKSLKTVQKINNKKAIDNKVLTHISFNRLSALLSKNSIHYRRNIVLVSKYYFINF